MKTRHLSAVALLLCTTGLIAGEQDTSSIQAGKKLVNTHCISCHASSFGRDGSGIYTREYRKVRSLSGLKAQVTNCNTMLNLKWFDDEEQQVVLYLNHTFYHF
ncbi:cytochrome c [Methylophilus aquaticus]|uniref:Cytochrome c n=1 Tax=Methylophilus aquaticus TaxID=1971610 RepID=A0ABT9JV38_9PROT|nr:cytochrome c [Methylophilus aquaticus]MDP8568428.1 cytochrome c [Methylophilus aquaticus]